VVVSSVTPLICGQTHRIPGRILGHLGLDRGIQHALFLAGGIGHHREILFRARAQMQQQRGVAAVVENHVGETAVGPLEDAVGVVPVVFQRFALDREHRHAGRGDRCSGMVLGREDVARGPAHFGAERGQRLDQHRGLDRHVQRTGDARALQRLGRGEFLADGHQARHFGFGDADFLAAPVGEGKIGNDVVGRGIECGVHHASFLFTKKKT
jgi:hypothetical protein